MRNSLINLKSNLIVRKGITEEEIFQLAKSFDIDSVYYQEEICYEEVTIENNLK